MSSARALSAPGLFVAAALVATTLAVAEPASVSAVDSGPTMNAATYECTGGHQVRKQKITLDSGKVRYTFGSSGCTDASHGEQRPCAEGNFGMPEPVACNWYWGGFLSVLVNGTDATAYRVKEMRVTETDARGTFQVIWAHPDAEVGLRLMLLPGGNHVLGQLVWHPREGATLKTVAVRLTCYPSFFTTANRRKGERHCQTPRTDLTEPQTLELAPDKDTYLYYYDTVFDTAKGEGSGPCAALVAPEGLAGGSVQIGDYAETTMLNLKPEAGQARLAFYDFSGQTNAAAASYMKTRAAADLAELTQADFRPQAARAPRVEALKADATKLLADAAEDGKALQPKVDALLAQVATLKAKAEAGDWSAEADLAGALNDSADLLWKLRTLAVLNNPG